MVDLPSVQPLPETGDWPGTIPRLENGWRITAGPVNPGGDEGLANWQAQQLSIRTRILKDRVDGLSMRAAAQVTVGPTGDYRTINAALEALSVLRSVYVPGGFTSTILLQSGFVMAEQVLVSGIDLSWITIDGVDAETLIDRSALYSVLDGSAGLIPAFGATYGGSIPRIGQLFSMTSTGPSVNRCGIVLSRGGRGTVAAGCGVKSASHRNVSLSEASQMSAQAGIFSGSGATGVSISGGSTINLVSATISGCAGIGIEASNGAIVAAVSANLSGCAGGGARATHGAMIAMPGANARSGAADAPTDIQVALSGEIRAAGATGGTNVAVNVITADGLIIK